jgi:nicotinamidase-related amidase
MADREQLLAALRHEMPVAFAAYRVPEAAGLVVIDEVNGFCTPGAGSLAPPKPDARIDAMVEETARLARAFLDSRRPVFATLDTHEPDRPEPPYPPHCIRGTGEENLVPALAFLENEPDATLLRKDCINTFVGAMEPATVRGTHGLWVNRFVDWANINKLETIVTVGICTDICVMDFVLTALSARNHGLLNHLRDIVVYEPACATYDLPRPSVDALGLPATAAHPRELAHHMGLYFMASRGALLADRLEGI